MNEIYYFIDGDGYVAKVRWDGDAWDNTKYKIGNCFKTREEAEFQAERLRVLAEMREFEESSDREWNCRNPHYFISYNIRMEKMEINYAYTVKDNNIYFETEEKARECILKVGADRIKRFYLRIKED